MQISVGGGGNETQFFKKQEAAYKNGSLNVSELARVCGMSRTTVYKYLSLFDR